MWTSGEVQAYLEGLVHLNIEQMRVGAVTQRLLKSHVRYQAEPLGSEIWQSAKETYELGFGDCEDLVSIRVAELRFWERVNAMPFIKDVRPGLRHCLVRHPDGRLECPSRALGMGKV
jgi:hypothetical protein